jgi:WhiB family redox-sensing transcriptional regulator
MRDAECSEWPAVDFFPVRADATGPAKAICSGCPVRQECLDYALADPSLVGVWSGTDERERRAMRSESA